jgi:hypothetical protein
MSHIDAMVAYWQLSAYSISGEEQSQSCGCAQSHVAADGEGFDSIPTCLLFIHIIETRTESF